MRRRFRARISSTPKSKALCTLGGLDRCDVTFVEQIEHAVLQLYVKDHDAVQKLLHVGGVVFSDGGLLLIEHTHSVENTECPSPTSVCWPSETWR